MVIFLSLDGTAKKVTPGRIYQGSNNVTAVNVVAPFPSTTALTIGFILPSGLATLYEPMQLAEQDAGNGLTVWTYNLKRSVTELMGDLYIAINAITAQGNTTSYLCKAVVEESVLPEPPPEPDPDVYELILLYLQQLDARTRNVGSAVKEVRQVAPNAFDTVTLGGTVSAPIVISGSGETPPLPIMAAGVVTIGADAWTPLPDIANVVEYYTRVEASKHGQMRDGAKPEDLWLSFTDASAGSPYEPKQCTVDSDGAVIVYANDPVAMTLRVWNGKGIEGKEGKQGPPGTDPEAREMITVETTRAEGAETALGERITQETTRATNAETALGERISAETTRAEGVEAGLQTQIDSLAAGELQTVAITDTGWVTADNALGAFSKAVAVPAGKRIICVLDSANQPRGTWSGSTIYANASFVGVAIVG